MIGIKVSVYKGEVAGKGEQPAAPALPSGMEEPGATKRVKKAAIRPVAKVEGTVAQGEAKPEVRGEAGVPAKPKATRPRARKAATAGEAAAKKGTEGAEPAKPKTAVKRVRKASETAGSGEKH